MLRAKYASALKYASMRSMPNALIADGHGAAQARQHLQLHINKNVSNVNQ